MLASGKIMFVSEASTSLYCTLVLFDSDTGDFLFHFSDLIRSYQLPPSEFLLYILT